MSGRRRDNNRIRGPQSALTDFLAANNISARAIRDAYQRRQDEDAGAAPQPQQDEEQAAAAASPARAEAETTSSSKKRKRGADKADKKKQLQKKKKKRIPDDSDDDGDDDDFDELGAEMYKKSKPKPGQLENCELCSKRFTVTPYSKTGPDGGLVCSPCGKELAAGEKKVEKKGAKKAGTGQKRRKAESNRLDGMVQSGPKSLQQMCVEMVAKHHHDIEEFGDLPDNLLDRLSEIFSKRRVLDPRTLQLFLRPGLRRVVINDAANLGVDDYNLIFAVTPHLTDLVLRNACQFKDAAVEYMLDKAHSVSHLQIYAANLISNPTWQKIFTTYAGQLKTVKLEWMDAAFTDDEVATLVAKCPNLHRLKLKYCRQLTSASLIHIAKLKNLEHLSLHFSAPIEHAELVTLITQLSAKLKTLSLENCPEADDSVLAAIASCRQLQKLRLDNLDNVTDSALSSLFSLDPNQSSLPPLKFLDLSSVRDMDSSGQPDPSADARLGVCSRAFTSVMTHSGATLTSLNLASCRHIEHSALCDSFNSRNHTYPNLETLNLSFCNNVDTSVIRGVFACCPNLRKVIAFGCFKIEDVVVPSGIALIGVPRAQESIEQFGEAGVGLDKALGMMDAMTEMGRPIAV